jgi:sulfur-oxidizing protein SoxY
VKQEIHMIANRRELLKGGAMVASLMLAAGVLGPAAHAAGAAAGKGAFDAKSLADLVKALGYGTPAESKDVSITAPDIAENGAVVPLGVATTLGNVKQVMLLVEKNPSVLAALFNVSPEIDANFSTRVKMGQSSNVFAVAVTEDNKVFFAQKEVKVTLGGCGG